MKIEEFPELVRAQPTSPPAEGRLSTWMRMAILAYAVTHIESFRETADDMRDVLNAAAEISPVVLKQSQHRHFLAFIRRSAAMLGVWLGAVASGLTLVSFFL